MKKEVTEENMNYMENILDEANLKEWKVFLLKEIK